MPGNLQIEQDQIVMILVMLFADLKRTPRGGDGNIAATAQHTLPAAGHWLSERRRSGFCREERQMNLS
jgi:hypothetical protein